jgi:Flp pilus assembly protein TadG
VALIEFAYSMPILMLLGFTGVELANLAIASMRVSQITMTVADNLSRAKQTVPLGLPQLREVDINGRAPRRANPGRHYPAGC